MAHLNHKGPEEKGPGTGRKLGLCKKKTDSQPIIDGATLGVGEGKKRHSKNCKSNGKRIYSGKNILME